MKYPLLVFLSCTLSLSAFPPAESAVILQYHHVNDTTPSSTSISPAQFEAHLQYLKEHEFTVVPLSEIMNSIKKQQPINDKSVVITFDDGYLDTYTQARPLLKKYNYPFSVFINPDIIEKGYSGYLSWQQVKTMAAEGVIFANHSFEHESAIRKPKSITDAQWLQRYAHNITEAELLIKERTGQNWQYFSYPYGEYSPKIQAWIKAHDFIAFSQQSGAIGLGTDLSSVPRYPVSQPYDKLTGLHDKLYSLPFSITLSAQNAQTVFSYQQSTEVTFNIIIDDFKKAQLRCFVSELGEQGVSWQAEQRFSITFDKPLPSGRIRSNCTAPSISQPGRFYWYSKPWFILDEHNNWYPL